MDTDHKRELTLPLLVAHSSQEYGNRPALGKAFDTPLLYKEFWHRIKQLSLVLKAQGVQKNDKVAILGENSPNWAIAYMAIIRTGAIAVPILPDLPESDVRHILDDAEVHILFISERQLEKIYEVAEKKLEVVVTLDDHEVTNNLVDTVSLEDTLNKADDLTDKEKTKLATSIQEIHEDDLAAVIYTSGTSGHSKAVMLTHKNLFSNVLATNKLVEITQEDVFLSILPMSHTYEFTLGFLLPMLNGARIVFAGKSPTPTILAKICAEEHPTVMCVVPLVMEKIYKKRILPKLRGSKVISLALKLSLLRKKIYQSAGKKLMDFFGGNLKLIAIGGAAFNVEVEKFFREAEFPYLVGYGLTETSPVLAGGPHKDPTIAVGSTGKVLPGVEIKIKDPHPDTAVGEILARGPNIMKGYYNNPELTRDTIDEDGWISTGDLGIFDENRNLHIKGRCKSVIVLSHGENIYPEAIEEKINAYAHVVESLVVENNDRLEARIYLDYDLIDQETANQSQQEKHTYIEKLLKQMKTETNSQLPSFSQVSQFIERPEPFIKTATHKIKRYLYTATMQETTDGC